ncbi:winged helix-turn-helix transcriptional regulator [Gorillibacterium timonense]|uniref:winged helix-turn-helix transcriptional regulator n=1 Tax=Gorillibacterium timonense TaxID=1689269 RepID=UPI00071E15CB|nr:response regulator transcription factor [Gorillibacterium timonense]
MPEFQSAGTLNAVTVVPEGAYCTTTHRIVIISPYPAALNPLIRELTANCYDVMVFHNESDPMLTLLQADLFLVDRTLSSPLQAFHPKKPADVLVLVPRNRTGEPGSEPVQEWPADPGAILARVEELIGHKNPVNQNDPYQLRVKDLVLDLRRMTVTRGEERIDLTKTEFDLLRVLLEAEGGVRSRQDFMELVWGDEYFGGSNYVDVHVKSLRQKLGDDSKCPRYIATVRGVGYRLAD